MNMSWGCGIFLATVFVFINLVGQIGGVVMVLARLRVPIACGLLFFIVILQVRSLDLHSTSDDYHIFSSTRRPSHIQFYGTFSSCSEIWLSLEHFCLFSQNQEMKHVHCLPVYQVSVITSPNHLCS
jgi:hypothetical protein